MKHNIKIVFAGLVFLLFIQHVSGQSSNADKLRKARILMNDYQDAALFRDMVNGTYDPSWEGIFKDLFKANRIVFDIPFRVDGKRFGNVNFQSESGSGADVIKIYQELVTPDKYIETIRNAYDLYSITDFHYLFVETKFDTLRLGSQGKIQFEFRKTFDNTDWSLRDSKSYLFDIQFFDNLPFITSVRAVDENIPKTDVVLAFKNAELGSTLADLVVHIKLEFDESINNTSLVARTDAAGLIRPGLIANRATILIDSIISLDGKKFTVPEDWRMNGYKVSSQPSEGFIVKLLPWKWNGFSWSAKAFGGMISQSENQIGNFASNSNFTNENGSMFGFGVEVAKHFSFAQISSVFNKTSTTGQSSKNFHRNTYIGAGSGISYYQYKYRITSSGFFQNPYPFSDRREEPLLVIVNGTSFNENVSGIGVSIPLFLDFRKNLPGEKKYFRAFSIQGGINLMIPFQTKYDLEGVFTRHGYYEQFNQQLMINDPFYNYYTDRRKSYGDNIVNNDVLPSWMFRLNGFFNISKGKSDNLLDVGVLMYFPFKGSSSNTDAFYIATGDDEFHSMSNSKNEIFNYFIGLSIGYSFINYRLHQRQ